MEQVRLRNFQNYDTDADTDSLLCNDYLYHQWIQVFDTVYMMVGKANPAYESTQTVVMLFYRQAFDYGHKGYAAAISIPYFPGNHAGYCNPDDWTEKMGKL